MPEENPVMLVRIGITEQPGGPPVAPEQHMVLIGHRMYDLDAVRREFGADSPEYQAARRWLA
jgi:hypothetical protein